MKKEFQAGTADEQRTEADNSTSASVASKPNVSSRLSNKDVLLIKEKILHCLVDDFKGNQAIFDRKEGWQVFNGTDLSMVMDSVVKGLKFAQSELNDRLRFGYLCP